MIVSRRPTKPSVSRSLENRQTMETLRRREASGGSGTAGSAIRRYFTISSEILVGLREDPLWPVGYTKTYTSLTRMVRGDSDGSWDSMGTKECWFSMEGVFVILMRYNGMDLGC